MPVVSRYESDFLGWTQDQANLIRSGHFSDLDIENLLEEIETMGRSDKRSFKSHLTILLMHLIKWQFQPERKSSSWRNTIVVQRVHITDIMEYSPSLKSVLDETMDKAWAKAMESASDETGIRESRFPERCPWTFAQIMDKKFWPDA